MAPLPQNNTHRLFVDYTSGGFQHTLTFRFPPSTVQATAVSKGHAICTSLQFAVNANDEFFAARWQPQDADFSLPVPWASISGTDAGAAWAEDPESAQLSVCGRSEGGRRYRFELFTIVQLSATWPSNNRYQYGDDTDPDGIISVVQAAAADAVTPICAIDNLPVIVYDYANISKNGYWERKQRVS